MGKSTLCLCYVPSACSDLWPQQLDSGTVTLKLVSIWALQLKWMVHEEVLLIVLKLPCTSILKLWCSTTDDPQLWYWKRQWIMTESITACVCNYCSNFCSVGLCKRWNIKKKNQKISIKKPEAPLFVTQLYNSEILWIKRFFFLVLFYFMHFFYGFTFFHLPFLWFLVCPSVEEFTIAGFLAFYNQKSKQLHLHVTSILEAIWPF